MPSVCRFLLATLITTAVAVGCRAAFAAWPPPEGIEFREEPLVLEAVGLRLPIPEDVRVELGPPGAVTLANILPKDEMWWMISIQHPSTREPGVSPKDFGDRIIERHRKLHGQVRAWVENGQPKEDVEHSKAVLTERISTLKIGEFAVDRFYMQMPDGMGKETILRGYTIVEFSPGRFLVFELRCDAKRVDESRRMYETIVAAAEFGSAIDQEAERGKAVMRGQAALSQLPESTYDEAVALVSDRWERLYLPAPTGADMDATELGYRRTRAWKGVRGELNPSLRPENYRREDLEPGYLFGLQSRLVQPDTSVIDSMALYFMSLDGKQEYWTITMTVRNHPDHVAGKPLPTYVETGARDDRTIRIIIHAPGEPGKEVLPMMRGGGYVSQVQSFLLPQLLILGGISNEYAFYAYSSRDQQIRLRTLRVERPAHNPSLWRVTVSVRPEEPPQISDYTQGGNWLRTVLADGKIWEPIDLTRLAELWRRKGLPMD